MQSVSTNSAEGHVCPLSNPLNSLGVHFERIVTILLPTLKLRTSQFRYAVVTGHDSSPRLSNGDFTVGLNKFSPGPIEHAQRTFLNKHERERNILYKTNSEK